VPRHEPRRLARLGLQLREPRRQRHGSAPAAKPAAMTTNRIRGIVTAT
jgi:hypothetical protein